MESKPAPGPHPLTARPDATARGGPPRIASQALLGEHDEIEIEHDGQLYRLRRTALGKLILTK